jgi:hypothetical protein
MFEITLSSTLTPDNIAAAFSRLIPTGLKIDVFPETDTPEEVGAIWAYLGETNDPAWPCIVNVIYGDECELGAYPDLRVAEYLYTSFGCNVLCDTYPFVGDLDPYDPYWSIAYVEGQWYLADTVDTLLMGQETGTTAVKLVRPITIPDIYH